MGSVGKVAFVSILGLGTLTGVLVYYIFGNAAPDPGVIESIYRQNLPTTEVASQDNSQSSSSEGANSTSANSTSANSTSANSTSANSTLSAT
jgi:hypothetical protein